ncbi:uncharacterized protein [Nicotiana tomentosiformis]|uniref:uncharacterized protein n=1 Tax=Nicotiana tomentosiformis TaxID=4098 RepID=UPI00388CA353
MPLTWQQFSVIVLEKFVPQSRREELCRQFKQLRQGDMSVTLYEMQFSELARHAIWLTPTDKIEMVRGQERVEREANRPRGHGGFCGTPSGGPFISLALPAQSSSRAPSGQGSSMLGPSSSYPGARGSLQSPALASGCCYECGEFFHMKRECPRLVGGPAPQRSQSMSSASVPPPPAESARGGAQSARGRPRGGGRSVDGQARFYALLSKPNAIALDDVITCIVSVCHRDASVLFDPGSTYS